MKPALVLGLALAANAMAADSDNNELFIAPQGKLVELAKKYPGMIMFDEQADDELAVKYVHLPHIPVPEVAAYDDELSLGGIRPRIGNDDEFCGRYRNRFKTEQEYHKFCASVIEDYKKTEARNRGLWKDDELALKYVHLPHIPAPEVAAYDDDELSLGGIRPMIGHDDEFCGRYRYRFNTEQEYHRFCASIIEEYRKTDAIAKRAWGDDELRLFDKDILPKDGIRRFYTTYIDKETGELKIAPGQYTKFAADDDELVAVKIPREKFPTEEAYRRYQVSLSEEVANDELFGSNPPDQHAGMIRIPSWQINDEVTDEKPMKFDKYDKTTLIFPGWTMHIDDEVTVDELFSNQSGNTTIKIPGWTMHFSDDEIVDDELAFRVPRGFIDRPLVKPAPNLSSEAFVRDDEADELLYLGQLIRDQVPMGIEGPKMKRKLRPVVDGASWAQN